MTAEADFLQNAPRNAREILTPEGVPLRFEVASVGDRAAAFLYDGSILAAVLAGITFIVAMTASLLGFTGSAWIRTIWVLLFFMIRTSYFIYHELRAKGSTPGKRRVGIRVMDQHGGPLRTEAVFIRNITREAELMIPMVAIFAPESVYPGAPAWAALPSAAWMLIFSALPFIHKSHMRAGDLLAGTLVVHTPRTILYGDLVSSRTEGPESDATNFIFTQQQLDIYGIYELQVLERVLRERGLPNNAETLRAIAEKVKLKIGWNKERWDVPARPFLETFYAAQRGRLEHKLLFGRRQERKKK